MMKKDKRLCWNCDGYVSFELTKCPYCASDLSQDLDKAIPQPPYPAIKKIDVSKEEWNQASTEKEEEPKTTIFSTQRKEMMALLLLMPGVVLILFALLLFFFSEEGVIHFEWKTSLAYFYLLGAIPLLVFGYRSLK